MIVPTLLVQASTDPKLRGAPLHVLCYLYGTRKYGNFQRVDHFEVAHMIHRTRQRVCQALRTLVAEGYLREDPENDLRGARPGTAGRYMLLFAREKPIKQSA